MGEVIKFTPKPKVVNPIEELTKQGEVIASGESFIELNNRLKAELDNFQASKESTLESLVQLTRMYSTQNRELLGKKVAETREVLALVNSVDLEDISEDEIQMLIEYRDRLLAKHKQ